MNSNIDSLPRSFRVVALLLAIGLALMAYETARRFAVDTSMEHFLPSGEERELYRVSREVVDSTLTRRMVFTLGTSNAKLSRAERRDSLTPLVATLQKRLSEVPGISGVTSGPPPGIEEDFFRLYFPRRFAFASLDPEREVKARLSDEALGKSAERLRDKLASTEGGLLRALAPQDPWLFFSEKLDRLAGSALSLDVHEGRFFARPDSIADPHEDHSILIADLEESALDSEAQTPVVARIEEILEETRAGAPFPIILEASGANRFAVDTQDSMKSDIERVFFLSTLGLLVLFVLLYRSFAKLLFLTLPILAGLVVASFCCLLIFDRLHAITLAFGGALIGVALDYPVHVLSHHDLATPGRTPGRTMREIFPSLGLAAGTTVAGLLGLAWASFPGIREIAIFSGLGVGTALTTTVVSAPLLLPRSGLATGESERVARTLESLFFRLKDQRRLAWAMLAVVLAVGLFGGTKLRFAPGLDSLAPLDESLLAEDSRVQARLGEQDAGKLVISMGETLDEALQVNEQVSRRLASAEGRALTSSITSPSELIRSKALQHASHEAVTGSPNLAKRTRDALEKAGFVPEAFGQLESELSRPLEPITLNELRQSKLRPLVDPLILELPSEWAVVTPLRGVTDESALSTLIARIGGASYFSQRTMLNQAYDDLRSRTTKLLVVGLLLVAVVTFVRYRRMRRTLAAVAPSILAAGATIGILSLLGQEVNLLHLLGLLLVCSMGVDYGVFLVDSRHGAQGSALLSVSVGCLSTMLSFGALSLSSAPALSALGTTIAIGIVLSLVLSPIALLLADVVPQGAEPS